MADLLKDNPLDLNQKHTKYRAVEAVREKAVDLYEGEHIVKAKRGQYLFQSETESERAYQRRLNRAFYDNWTLPPVTARQALLWNKTPTREKFGDLESMVLDVDGQGTPADVFFREVTERAQVEGMVWVLVDKPGLPATYVPPTERTGTKAQLGPAQQSLIAQADQAVLTVAQEAEANIRPFFAMIPGGAVLDWDVGPDRELLWAVIAQYREEKPAPGVRATRIEQRFIWYRDQWEIWEVADKETGATATGIDSVQTQNQGDPTTRGSMAWKKMRFGPNGLGRVPLVPFYGMKQSDFLGWPVIKDILGHVIAIYNKASDRDNGEFKTNNPIPWIISEENPQQVAVSSDNGIWIKSAPDSGATAIGYLEHSGAGIEASRTSERDLIARIFEISLQQAKKESRQVQSAQSLKMESRLFNASLSSTATYAEAGEMRCWQMAWAWNREGAFPGSVLYVTDFEDNQIEETFLTVLSTMVEKRQLSHKTHLAILSANEVLPKDIDPEEEFQRIKAEDDELGIPRVLPIPQLNPESPEENPEEEIEETS